jgi:adenine-specific DNA-methyltransferase
MATKGVHGPKKSSPSPKGVSTDPQARKALASYGTKPHGTQIGAPPGQPAKVLPMPLQLQYPEPKKPRGKGQRQSRSHKAAPTNIVEIFKHDAKRRNNPLAGLIEFDKPPAQPTKTYAYDAHLDPQLTWAGKAEHTSFEIDTVSLHIHERVSTQAVLSAVKREDVQTDFFARLELPESKVIDFYQHEVGWANRLILGDSLTVMNSLLEREQMAGKVQMIYVDPPYGVKFNSNFQPWISKRDVKDADDASLTREPEQIQAYRDTWTLGVHSYLTYLRDRLLLSRELLTDSGSVFVQIGDENVHLVRCVLDEVFGSANFCSLISYAKTTTTTGRLLPGTNDYILWYAKDNAQVKYRPLYQAKAIGGAGATKYDQIELANGQRRAMTAAEKADPDRELPPGARPYRLDNLTSPRIREARTGYFSVEVGGRKFLPKQGEWKTNPQGMQRLVDARRVQALANSLGYVRFIDDFPAFGLTNSWSDVGGIQSRSDPKIYVVQTSATAIERAMLMTTDPGDLVLDPTCGSGTTAVVAEEFGRRWITCDTSRVALALARQRVLTARFPYYRLRSTRVRDGFYYKAIPHITLKSIAQNARLDECKSQTDRERVIRMAADKEVLYDQPEVDNSRIRVTGPFTVEAIPVASLDDNQPAEAAGSPEHPATDYLSMMIDLLKKSGVQFPNNRHLAMPSLRAVRGPYEHLHAEAEIPNGVTKRVAISFGPRHAPVTPMQVLGGISETRGYDIVVFVGFACDPEARKIIDAGVHGRELQYANAAPDILVGDLLRTTKTTRLFTAFGAPDVKVEADSGDHIKLTLAGVDFYDPNSGETSHRSGDDVAAWFIDHDYDGRTFCICQALFPGGGKNPWEKLQKALKGTIHEDKFEMLRTAKSLPFKPGKKVAVKVVDDRGNEVIKLVDPKRPGKKGSS